MFGRMLYLHAAIKRQAYQGGQQAKPSIAGICHGAGQHTLQLVGG
jgi:hypothetical protein